MCQGCHRTQRRKKADKTENSSVASASDSQADLDVKVAHVSGVKAEACGAMGKQHQQANRKQKGKFSQSIRMDHHGFSEGEWRQEANPWLARTSGETIHNPPNIWHAMKAGNKPLLAIWMLWMETDS